MSITEELLKSVKCCLDEEKHIIEDPVLLPCGHHACRKCITSKKGKPYECLFPDCDKTFDGDENYPLPTNKTLEILMKNHLKDLFSIIQEKVAQTIKEFEDINYEEKIDTKLDNITKEINNRIELLKTEIDKLNLDFQQQVTNLRTRLKKLIPNNELESMRNYMLKTQNNPTPKLENLYEYQNKLRSIKQTVSEFSRVNIYPLFEVSELSIDKSIVGNIFVSSYNCYLLKKRMLLNTIKFIDLKFKPTRLCALSKTTLCITHSEANKITLYSKDFEFMKAIDRVDKLPFNNPTGIVSDGKHTVYICDTGNNRILLCNLNFKLIEVFDESSLGDYEINRPTEIFLNSGFLYISDNLGARIHKFTTEMSYVESYDVNQNPFQIAAINNVIFVSDLENHSSHFYNEKLFPSSNQNSRCSSENEADETADFDSESPCCETYDNEGPICIVDSCFLQWNKFTKIVHFYSQEGKLESSIRLKSLIKTETKKKQFRRTRLYRHEKFLPLKEKNQKKQVKPKPAIPTFDKITRSNFQLGNYRKRVIVDHNIDTNSDICYFNGKLLITYTENKLIVV